MENIGEKRFREPSRERRRREKIKVPEEKISISKGIDYLSESEIAKGEKDFEKAVKCCHQAIGIFGILAKEHPEDKKVVAGFRKSRNSLKEIKQIWANNLYNLGEKSKTEGRHPEAIEYFERAIKKNPKLIDAWVGAGELLFDLGNYEKAYKFFNEGRRENEASKEIWKIWNAWGKFYLKLGEFHQAYTCFSEAETEKENPESEYNLGVVFLNLEIGDPVVNIIRAFEYFEKAEKKAPKVSAILRSKSLASFKLFQARGTKEALLQVQTSKENLIKATEIDPKDMVAWYNLGVLVPILQEGKPKEWIKEADDYFDKALDINAKRKTKLAADCWHQKALLSYYSDLFNPYRGLIPHKESLKECFQRINRSLEIYSTLTPPPLEEIQAVQVFLKAEVEERAKKLKDWAIFKGAKKTEPLPGYV